MITDEQLRSWRDALDMDCQLPDEARDALPDLISEVERLRDENCDSPWRAGEQRALESMRQLRDEALKQLAASSAEVERLRTALRSFVDRMPYEYKESVWQCEHCQQRAFGKHNDARTLQIKHLDTCGWAIAWAALGEVKR